MMNTSTLLQAVPKIVIVFLFFFVSDFAYSQSSDGEVRALYAQAEESFEKGKYRKASNLIDEVESQLGASNPMTTALKVRLRFAQRNYRGAKALLEEYFAYNTAHPVLTEDMLSYAKSISELWSAKLIDGIRAELKRVEAREKEEFRKANEENVWQNALSRNTVYAFQNYLNTYHDGKYIPEAKEHIYQLKARALYNKIVSTRELKYYEQYYNQYKRGENFKAVKEALKQSYLNYGNAYYEKKYWKSAKSYYDNYLVMLGGANFPAEVSQKMQEINRMLSQSSFSTFSFTYEDKSYGGIMGGDFYKDRRGWYFRLRARSHLFSELEETELDFPEGQDSFEEEGRYGDSVWIRQFTKTGNEAYKNLVFSAGITQKLSYPLWVNLGIGMGYFELWNEVEEDQLTRSGNDYYWEYAVNTAFDKDTEHPAFGLVFEGGLNLYLKPFVLHYGYSSSYGSLNPYFGIGLNL